MESIRKTKSSKKKKKSEVSKKGNQNNTSLGDPCQKGMVLCSREKRLSTVNPKAHASESNNMKDMERSK